jgi:hypothetical protein
MYQDYVHFGDIDLLLSQLPSLPSKKTWMEFQEENKTAHDEMLFVIRSHAK